MKIFPPHSEKRIHITKHSLANNHPDYFHTIRGPHYNSGSSSLSLYSNMANNHNLNVAKQRDLAYHNHFNNKPDMLLDPKKTICQNRYYTRIANCLCEGIQPVIALSDADMVKVVCRNLKKNHQLDVAVNPYTVNGIVTNTVIFDRHGNQVTVIPGYDTTDLYTLTLKTT
jgi:hypothetical protein